MVADLLRDEREAEAGARRLRAVGADEGLGGAGNDRITGVAGNDRLAGGAGDDMQDGGAGNDTIFANAGRDTSTGGDGNDVLWALARADVTPGPGGATDTAGDTLDGGNGDDVFRTRDGEADRITCGAGTDRALLDTVDVIADATAADPNGSCEQVRRRAPGGNRRNGRCSSGMNVVRSGLTP